MSTKQRTMLELICDGCGESYEADDQSILFDNDAEIVAALEYCGWSTDGEGKHHCWDCPVLELTEDAAADAARAPHPGDVPLEGS